MHLFTHPPISDPCPVCVCVGVQTLGVASSHDRALIKKKAKDLKVLMEKARRNREKLDKQREKLRKKELEQQQKQAHKPSSKGHSETAEGHSETAEGAAK